MSQSQPLELSRARGAEEELTFMGHVFLSALLWAAASKQ